MATFEITKLSSGGHVKVHDTTNNRVFYYSGTSATAKVINNTIVIDPENDDKHTPINVVVGVDTITYFGVVPAFSGTATNPVDHCDYLNAYYFFEPGGDALTTVVFTAPLTGDGTIGDPGRIQNGTAIGDGIYWNGTAWAISLKTVSTSGVLTGNGEIGNPVRLINGTNTGDIPIWDGANWIIQPNPSWNLEARRNVKTFTFAGGFTMSSPNQNYLVGTPLQRNSASIIMLTPGIAGRDPIIQIPNSAGVWLKLRTPDVAGSFFVVSNTSAKKYYYRQKIKVSSNGNSRHGFIDAPAITVLNGFGFETISGNLRAFCNTGASYTYGSSFGITIETWYDCEVEYQYTGGNMVCYLFVDGILRSTAIRLVGAFTFEAGLQSINSSGATPLIIHTDLIEYSIYG